MHTRGDFIFDMYIVVHLFNIFESQGNNQILFIAKSFLTFFHCMLNVEIYLFSMDFIPSYGSPLS